jgi:hypothetical protein
MKTDIHIFHVTEVVLIESAYFASRLVIYTMSWRLRKRLLPSATRDVRWAAWGLVPWGVVRGVMRNAPLQQVIYLAGL